MRTVMKKTLLFWMLVLCGCAPQKMWFNPTRNFTQAQADLYGCQQAGEAPPLSGAAGPGLEPSWGESEPVSACMKARGYYLVDKKFADAYRNAE
jgi:hypothetical protein